MNKHIDELQKTQIVPMIDPVCTYYCYCTYK